MVGAACCMEVTLVPAAMRLEANAPWPWMELGPLRTDARPQWKISREAKRADLRI